MKADVEHALLTPVASESKLYIGQVVRRQGQYGAVAAVARVGAAGIDVIEDAKRLFPRDGQAETHGVVQHNGLAVGDWVEFDTVRNTRPRSHEYKVHHLRRVPRYAVLPEATMSVYRAMLTVDGWRGDRRPGLWALRATGDLVLVAELETGKDGALRIARSNARNVRVCDYRDDLVASVRSAAGPDEIFLDDRTLVKEVLDWSDEADHVARVIRSLSDANDERVADLIAWLDLHHEDGTGRIFAATVDHGAAASALRSGELAERLRADRSLMEAYMAAVLQNEAVRAAVAEYAREGHGEERARLRKAFEQELADQRADRIAQIEAEMAAERAEAAAKLDAELDEIRAEEKRRANASASASEAEHAARMAELDRLYGERKADIDSRLAAGEEAITTAKAWVEDADAELARLEIEIVGQRARLGDAKGDVDRMLSIADRLAVPKVPLPVAGAAPARAGMGLTFPVRSTVSIADKGRLIERQVLLTAPGKDMLRNLVALLLSGEVPMLHGSQALDLLRFAEAVICPGRYTAIEADPTLISIDDLWSRAGSGAPTAMAEASSAAEGGAAVLVAIRGMERSGARFWLPALAETRRGGRLPRGLFVCCVVNDVDHEELIALPMGSPRIGVEGAFEDGAYMAAPSLLSGPMLDLEAMDVGAAPTDLSGAGSMLAELGLPLGIDEAMRVARVYVEALSLTGDAGKAVGIATELAKTMAMDAA